MIPVTRDSIDNLQEMIAKLPQVELPTRHYVLDGMYAREMFIPAGTALVGRVHKKEHFFIVTKGKISIASEGGVIVLVAGALLTSKPGIKRAGYAIEDTICVTVHKIEGKTLEDIEEELSFEDPNSMFGLGNTLKKALEN